MKNTSNHAAAAKMIRAELKKNGIKASVRAKSYSGGSSITVDILEDITPAAVKEISAFCDRFEMGSFNGMEDIYEYNNRNDDLPQVKFVFVNMDYSDELRAEARAYVEANYAADDEYRLQEETRNVINGYWGNFWINRKPRVKVAA